MTNITRLLLPQPQHSDTIIYLALGIVCFLLLLLIYHQRRNGYPLLVQARNRFNQAIIRFRLWRNALKQRDLNKKDSQKVSGDDQPTSKPTFGVIQSQKTFADGEGVGSRQETSHTNGSYPEDFKQMGMEDDTPQVNLKEVIKKEKGKDNHKSRSKLRGKVHIKKSQLQAEEEAYEEQTPGSAVRELNKESIE